MEYDRQQLMVELNKLAYSKQSWRRGGAPQTETIVAQKLYKTKDKDTAQLVSGLTVAKLIEQSTFSSDLARERSRESLRARDEVLLKADVRRIMSSGGSFGIYLYAYHCLYRAIKRCLENKDNVVVKGDPINEQEWLDGLREAMRVGSEIEENVYYGDVRATLPLYIIKGTRTTDELTREELMEQLGRLRYQRLFNVKQFVANSLEDFKDKSTIVVNGVSVAKLSELNNPPKLADCSVNASKQRAMVLAEVTSNEHLVEGATFGLDVYAFRCLHDTVSYCLANKEQVIEEGINERKWLEGLRQFMWNDFDIEYKIYSGHEYSFLPHYMVNGPRIDDKDDRLAEQVSTDGTLMGHPSSSSELSRDELMNRLDRLRPNSYYSIAELVLEYLYKTKDKATTEVLSGFTVGELIAFNRVDSLKASRRDALKHRNQLYFETKPKKGSNQDNVLNAVSIYMAKCISLRARYCHDNETEVIKKGINNVNYMGKMRNFIEDSLTKQQRALYKTGPPPKVSDYLKKW